MVAREAQSASREAKKVAGEAQRPASMPGNLARKGQSLAFGRSAGVRQLLCLIGTLRCAKCARKWGVPAGFSAVKS